MCQWKNCYKLQEAQLPQRNSASAAHADLGWPTDRALHRQNYRRIWTTVKSYHQLSVRHTCRWSFIISFISPHASFKVICLCVIWKPLRAFIIIVYTCYKRPHISRYLQIHPSTHLAHKFQHDAALSEKLPILAAPLRFIASCSKPTRKFVQTSLAQKLHFCRWHLRPMFIESRIDSSESHTYVKHSSVPSAKRTLKMNLGSKVIRGHPYIGVSRNPELIDVITYKNVDIISETYEELIQHRENCKFVDFNHPTPVRYAYALYFRKLESYWSTFLPLIV